MTDATPGDTPDGTDSGEGTTRRRPVPVKMLAVVLLAVAALCLWASSRMTWVRVDSFDGLGAARTTDVIGGTWAAATTPLALALLAAIAASFAVRGWALRVLGLLVAAAAVGAVVPAVSLLTSDVDPDRAGRLAELPDRAEVTATVVSTGPAVIVVVGCVAALVAAVLLVLSASSSTGLSARYSAPAARREEAARRSESSEPPSQRSLWDALDAGDDPTAGDGPADGDGTDGDQDGPDAAPGTRTRN